MELTVPIVEKIIAKSSKRVADGRPLPKEWLTGAAKSYDKKQYAARVNLEHIMGWSPNSDFRVYGTVESLKTTPAPKGEVYLVAEIDAHDDLSSLWDKGQKRAFSVEIIPDFADIHEPYLSGLAATDMPASLGTHFSNQSDKPSSQQYTYCPDNDTCHCTHEDYNMPKDSDLVETNISASSQPDTQALSADNTSETATTPDESDTPATFSQQLAHFSTELATVRAERDALRDELAQTKADFSTEKTALKTAHAEALAAKDEEIEEWKCKVPADGFTPRSKTDGSEDGNHAFKF